jgi:hypothetical protein
MSRPNRPPTHTLWSQHRDHGRFREWYKSGHVWLEKDEKGEIIGCSFQAMHARAGDGFTWFFPVGKEPPPPEEAKRPGSQTRDEF